MSFSDLESKPANWQLLRGLAEIHLLDNQLTALSRKQIKIRSSTMLHKNEEISTPDNIEDESDLKCCNENGGKSNQDSYAQTTECKIDPFSNIYKFSSIISNLNNVKIVDCFPSRIILSLEKRFCHKYVK